MKPTIVLTFAVLPYSVSANSGEVEEPKSNGITEAQFPLISQEPIGKSGLTATYRHESDGLIPGSTVRTFKLVNQGNIVSEPLLWIWPDGLQSSGRILSSRLT